MFQGLFMQALALGSLCLLGACASSQLESQDAAEAAARLTDPSPEVRAELRAVVAASLHTSTVTLADDALTASSVLIIERTPARDASGRPFSGRDLDRPQHFQLVKQGKRCVLIHQESGTRTQLKTAACEVAREADQ